MARQAHTSAFSGGAASRRVPDLAFLADSVTARQERILNDLHPRQRSVARRVKKRLVLGIAALALFGLSVWIIPAEPADTTSAPSADSPALHRIEKSQERIAAAKPRLATQSMAEAPSWLQGALAVPPPAIPSLRTRPGP